jgi:prolyl oligopeptidase
VLEAVTVVGERFFASYLADAHNRVRIFDLAGGDQGEVDLPGLGTVSELSGRREDHEAFFAFTSFTIPSTTYRHGIDEGSAKGEGTHADV